MTKSTMTFSITTRIDANKLVALLVSAFDAGINYWCSWETVLPANFDLDKETWLENPNHWKSVRKCYIAPFVEGGKVWIFDHEDTDIHGKPKRYTLDRAAVERGVEVMSRDYIRHWQNFITENDDAITGDVFMQCCIFGEIVYG